MNNTRYIIARFALYFGIHRRSKRLAEAADETHLLHQAEEILGEDVWEEVEDIEEINVEYWNLRKLKLNMEKLRSSISEAGQLLSSSQEERDAILNQANQACLDLEERRDEYVQKAEGLGARRNEIIAEAQQIKRQFEAARTKVQVLSEESGTGEVIKVEREKLAQYKIAFNHLKEERERVGGKITELEQKIADLGNTIGRDRKKLRDEASHAYQSIGKANKDITQLGAKLGFLETEMKQHFVEIGRYVSMHAASDARCAKICRNHARLIAQIQSLRNSIAMNHRLALLAEGQ